MHAQVDAGKLRQALSKQLFGRVVAANELVLVHVEGRALLVRITEVNSLDEEAREEALSYHCFRGLVTPETLIWITDKGAQTSSHHVHGGCHLSEVTASTACDRQRTQEQMSRAT